MFEAFYEFLSDFGIGLAGPKARPYIPIFAAFFILILFNNWIGLVPPVGKIPELRAPSSDVNITIGLALVSFVIFHVEGFRHLGVRGYLGKILMLTLLAPDIVEAIRDGRQPAKLEVHVLRAGFPVEWKIQRWRSWPTTPAAEPRVSVNKRD